jgi:hypothetical protein
MSPSLFGRRSSRAPAMRIVVAKSIRELFFTRSFVPGNTTDRAVRPVSKLTGMKFTAVIVERRIKQSNPFGLHSQDRGWVV